MSPNSKLTLKGMKAQAKALRNGLAEQGQTISHAQSLELLAKQLGARDWNTLAARADVEPNARTYAPGQEVRGRYLGQVFCGTVLGAQVQNSGARTRLTIQFDAPLNVVPEASFEVLRRRIKATVGPDGATFEKTSNGLPHLVLDAET